jgi:hypothetical protein
MLCLLLKTKFVWLKQDYLLIIQMYKNKNMIQKLCVKQRFSVQKTNLKHAKKSVLLKIKNALYSKVNNTLKSIQVNSHG